MAYPARPRQSAKIVTTNAEESAEAEVADLGLVMVKDRIVSCLDYYLIRHSLKTN